MLITFSGLDGAGKTTLIRKLSGMLRLRRNQVAILTMYDHVGVYALVRYLRGVSSRLRDRLVRNLLHGHDHPAGPGGTSKNGEPGLATQLILKVARAAFMRRIVLIIDLCLFPFYRLYFEKWRSGVLILDRYFYDSLADVADGRHCLYIRLFLKVVPHPDLPISVDICPRKAYARKGEYSVEYLTRRRGFYKEIFGRVDRPLVFVNDDLAASLSHLETALEERMGKC